MDLDMSDIVQQTKRLLDQREHDQADFDETQQHSKQALERFDSLLAQLKDTLAQA
jgi:peptidoglycan hydrolase CwlO-like protein